MIISDELKDRIRKSIIDNINTEHITFYLGGYGAFDNACAHIVKMLKNEYPNIKSVFVTPYLNSTRLQDIMSSKLYDESIYPDLEKVPYRFAISKRNEYMTEHADLLICYVNTNYGGAYKTLMYAKSKKKRIINLAYDQ